MLRCVIYNEFCLILVCMIFQSSRVHVNAKFHAAFKISKADFNNLFVSYTILGFTIIQFSMFQSVIVQAN
jgi:hypothetical protein